MAHRDAYLGIVAAVDGPSYLAALVAAGSCCSWGI